METVTSLITTEHMDDFESRKLLVCYLDEAGDFNFSPNGTKHYLCTALVTEKPLPLQNDLLHMKYLLVMNNKDISKSHHENDYFHATEDAPLTRRLVYSCLSTHSNEYRVYSVIVQKNKTNPSIRDPKDFYALVFNRLIREVIAREKVRKRYDHLLVITDKIPVRKKRSAVISSIKHNVKQQLLDSRTTYTVKQMESKTDFGLQAADYASWSIFQVWERGESHYRHSISHAIVREVDYFHYGKTEYYQYKTTSPTMP